MHHHINDKLTRGLRRLAQAGDDPDLLGAALISVHGALEDQFRAVLATNTALSSDQRAAISDPRRVQWRELLDLMQLHGDLSAEARRVISRANALRQEVAHGGRYTGNRSELEAYAQLVAGLCGYQPETPTPEATTNKTKPKRRSKPEPAAEAVQPAEPDPPALKPAAAEPTEAVSPAANSATAPATPKRRPQRPRRTQAVPKAAPAPTAVVTAWQSYSGLGALALLTLLIVLACSAFWQLTAQPLPAVPTPIATLTAQPEPALLPQFPRTARVVGLAGSALYVRSGPSLAANPLEIMLSEGDIVRVVGGPSEADGYTWWQIEAAGQQGWCAGEYLAISD